MTLDTSTATATTDTRQPLTAEEVRADVRDWAIAQKALGDTDEVLLEKLCIAGWEENTARRALGLPEVAQPAPEASPRPGPDLQGLPSSIDVGDREVQVLMRIEHPRVVLFGGLLSDYECAALVRSARAQGLERSQVLSNDQEGSYVDPIRTSEGMFFHRGSSELIQRLEARIARLLRWPVDHGEGLQVLHYYPGGEYVPHYDYFLPDAASTPGSLKEGGQRVGTLIMYLDNTEAGGATVFPESKLAILPRRGHALFFGYDRPDPATLTLHGGAPVVRGEKWIATKWLRERPNYAAQS